MMSGHNATANAGARMNHMVEWIAANALSLWALLLVLGVLGGDLAWHCNGRWHRRASQRSDAPTVWRWWLAVLLMLALVTFFAAIAWAIFGQQTAALADFDASLAEHLRAQLPHPALQMIAMLTHLGDPLWVALVSSLVLLALLVRRHRQLALAWAVAVLGILPINGGLKAIFRRVRPLHDHGFISEPGWSFPSGHAFGSVVFYGMLAYVLLRLSPRHHRAIIAAAMLLIGAVGTSRILLQVHYFSDVLAGYTAGAAWLVVCVAASEAVRARIKSTSP